MAFSFEQDLDTGDRLVNVESSPKAVLPMSGGGFRSEMLLLPQKTTVTFISRRGAGAENAIVTLSSK